MNLEKKKVVFYYKRCSYPGWPYISGCPISFRAALVVYSAVELFISDKLSLLDAIYWLIMDVFILTPERKRRVANKHVNLNGEQHPYYWSSDSCKSPVFIRRKVWKF